MMVWKMYLLSNMAILGIYVRFLGGYQHDMVSMASLEKEVLLDRWLSVSEILVVPKVQG